MRPARARGHERGARVGSRLTTAGRVGRLAAARLATCVRARAQPVPLGGRYARCLSDMRHRCAPLAAGAPQGRLVTTADDKRRHEGEPTIAPGYGGAGGPAACPLHRRFRAQAGNREGQGWSVWDAWHQQDLLVRAHDCRDVLRGVHLAVIRARALPRCQKTSTVGGDSAGPAARGMDRLQGRGKVGNL